jgi:hypothetical protein
MVGQTEETLTANKVSYEVGIARYSELAKTISSRYRAAVNLSAQRSSRRMKKS